VKARRRGAASFFDRVYEVVRTIPAGEVLTYGQVARALGVPRGARAVGWALRALHGREAARTPWHRVVGAGGRISPRAGAGPLLQRRRLQAEGVRFRNGRAVILSKGALRRAPATPAAPAAGAERDSFARGRWRNEAPGRGRLMKTPPRASRE
jgi:methylated-DNA-protein-cysteine methyltransferase-like protein